MITSRANTFDFLFVNTSAEIIAHITFWSKRAVTSERLLFDITSAIPHTPEREEDICVRIVAHSQHFGAVI